MEDDSETKNVFMLKNLQLGLGNVRSELSAIQKELNWKADLFEQKLSLLCRLIESNATWTRWILILSAIFTMGLTSLMLHQVLSLKYSQEYAEPEIENQKYQKRPVPRYQINDGTIVNRD